MSFEMDPEIMTALAPIMAETAGLEPAAVGDIPTRRQRVEARQALTASLQPRPTDVTIADHYVDAADGHSILLRWYTKDGSAPGSAVLYAHGGGMILSNVGLYDGPIARHVSRSGVPFLAVEYRYAPEHPHPTLVEDCFSGLVWLHAHAVELGVDPARIAVMGDSGGGGVAAGLALLARDRGGPAIAAQILLYPMLDDRTVVPDAALAGFATWTWDDNATGWGALLGTAFGTEDVSPYAAPARAASLAALPGAYVEVGELDVFRDEDVEYARRLAAAGVSTELHVHPAVPHAFETFAPEAAVSLRSRADRLRVLRSL